MPNGYPKIALEKLHPAEWNPRTIKDQRFKDLCKALTDDPEFLEDRPICATKNGTVYAGNQRFRAAQFLGWKDIPCSIRDIPEILAKKRAIIDNNNFGEWDPSVDDILAELEEIGVTPEEVGMQPKIEVVDPSEEWKGMPEFNQEDKTAYRQILVSFANETDVKKFGKAISQSLSEKTRFIWFPEAEIDRVADTPYIQDGKKS